MGASLASRREGRGFPLGELDLVAYSVLCSHTCNLGRNMCFSTFRLVSGGTGRQSQSREVMDLGGQAHRTEYTLRPIEVKLRLDY